MALCTLLKTEQANDPTFNFEHNQSHRRLLGSMSPLDQFSAIPYYLNPNLNNGFWHQDHQQAHTDVISVYPGYFGGRFRRSRPTIVETTSIIGPGYNIQDVNLDDGQQLKWWTFQNHYTHLDAESIQNPAVWVWPFW